MDKSMDSLACDFVERSAAELCDEDHEDHPHDKTTDQENNSEKEKRGRGRPPVHGLSGKPIYRSFREARRRCTDPKCPDYERYGGRGIEFRINTVTALFDAIGDRPPNATLDRINPDGHYEVGNLRWASPKEQANNRCRGPKDCHPKSLGWNQVEEARATYLQMALHWTLSIKGLARPRVSNRRGICVPIGAPCCYVPAPYNLVGGFLPAGLISG